MINYLLRLISIVLLGGVTAFAVAHTYFFGLTDLTLNESSNKIEVIHQFTTHDLENAIAELEQISFSPEHKYYENHIQSYVEKNFSLRYLSKEIDIKWIGIEIKRGNIFIYQEAPFENFLTGLLVKNELLVNTYPKQINTLNFQDSRVKGSLSFTALQKIAKIDSIK